MKKKGFTLIETILCIAIISAVSLGMFFLIKKDKNLDDKKVQFQEKILLASSLYFDNKKNSNLHNIVYDYGGRGHIKLSDLIDVGLISDDLTNPYKNKSILDTKDECVHLYLDEDKDFVIEYPLKNEDRLCKNEVIDVPKRQAYTLIWDQIPIMSSKKTIELIKQKIASDEEECFDAFTCFFDIKQEYKDGTYIKNNLDISLIDVVTDEIIETNREAWDLEVNYNEEKDLFEVSHKIKEGYLLEGYEEVYNNDTYAEVYLVDYDPPLLVDIFDYNEYNGELIALDVIEFEEDYEKNYYLKAKNYIFFDNYDGFIEMDKLTKDDINDINEDNESYDNLLEIHDSNYVYNDYYPVKYKIVKEPLEIFYTGDTYLTVEYITESDPFYKHIEIKGHYLEDTLLYDLKKSTTGEFVFYNDVYPPDWYSLDSGVYNLRISVADYFGEKKTKTVTFHFDSVYDWDWEDEVYIMEDDADPYDECMAGIYCYSPSPPPEPEPYVCDDACYIALMKNNSQKWHETDDPNTKAALHAQNVSYSQKLSYSTTYNSHTGTYNKSNGDAIYTKSDLYR